MTKPWKGNEMHGQTLRPTLSHRVNSLLHNTGKTIGQNLQVALAKLPTRLGIQWKWNAKAFLIAFAIEPIIFVVEVGIAMTATAACFKQKCLKLATYVFLVHILLGDAKCSGLNPSFHIAFLRQLLGEVVTVAYLLTKFRLRVRSSFIPSQIRICTNDQRAKV